VFQNFPVRAYPWQDSDFVSWDQRVDPEYMLAELGRSILYAGNKAAGGDRLRPPAKWDLAWGQSKGEAGSWMLNVVGPKRDLNVSWRVRDLQNKVGSRTTSPAWRGGAGGMSLHAARPGRGTYYLDVFIDGPQGRENYGYSGIRIATPYQVVFKPEKTGWSRARR